MFSGSSVVCDENYHQYKLWAGLSWIVDYQNFYLKMTEEEILTEVFKYLECFHPIHVSFFIFTPEKLSGCQVD